CSNTPEWLAVTCSSRTSRPRQGQLTQCVDIDLCIDFRGLGIAMTQDLADLTERGALTQHLGGQCMAKLMCSVSGCVYSGALDGVPNNRSNAAGTLKAADRGFIALCISKVMVYHGGEGRSEARMNERSFPCELVAIRALPRMLLRTSCRPKNK